MTERAANPPETWLKVRRQLGHQPVVTGAIGGAMPLFVERYVYQAFERTVAPLDLTGFVTQFGGSRVRQGDSADLRSEILPTYSMLIPHGMPTRWHYTGTVDFAVFYFLGIDHPVMAGLERLALARATPLQFMDPLVGAAARQLVNELQKGESADPGYLERLAGIMLEQAFRVLTTPVGGIDPRHAHYARLQRVLNHITEHLAEPLGAESLAAIAGVSLAHFRRVFQDATGIAPHRYLLNLRLERARVLLTQSSLPLARIAQECGFASQSHLTAAFRAAHAATPAQFRASRRGG